MTGQTVVDQFGSIFSIGKLTIQIVTWLWNIFQRKATEITYQVERKVENVRTVTVTIRGIPAA